MIIESCSMALGQKWHCPHCRRGSPRYGRGSHCDGPNGGAAAQTRMVSVAEIRLDLRESTRLFKGIICVDISEFESYMPSHAVWSLWAMSGCGIMRALSSGV